MPDTLVHVEGQGHGRTRVRWQKVRWSSELHETSTHLVWAPGESYIVDDKLEATAETMRDELLMAVRADPGANWTKIRSEIRGKADDAASVRDGLLAEGLIVNVSSRKAAFKLIAADGLDAASSEPSYPFRSSVPEGTERERMARGAGHCAFRSSVPALRGNGERNETADPDELERLEAVYDEEMRGGQ